MILVFQGCALGTGDKLAGASSAEVKNEWSKPPLPPVSSWHAAGGAVG